MACYSKMLSTIVKASTIIMLKYCIHKLGCKSSITKILNNRLGSITTGYRYPPMYGK